MQPSTFQNKHLLVATRGCAEFVSQANVLYLEASSNYCFIHLKEGKCRFVSRCLKHILLKLDSSQFIKIHSKFAVNINYIESIDFSTSKVFLCSGVVLSMSRSRKRLVKNWVKIYSNSLEIAC